MKKSLTLAVAVFFAAVVISIAAPPSKDALMAKETTAWQTFKDKKADDFKKLLSSDFCGVYSDGVYDFQKEVDDMKAWDMKSFTISDYKIVAVGTDTVISNYKVVIEGTKEGKDASGTFNCGSVWKMEKGAWKAIFHTNAKAEAAAK
jgi:hypothetical protein